MRESDKYILMDGEPRPERNLLRWARWFEDSGEQRIVARTFFGDGTVRVSTVFLGLDHSFGQGPPVLWETMVFGGPLHHEMERYTSRGEAEAGHRAMVKRVEAAIAKHIAEALD